MGCMRWRSYCRLKFITVMTTRGAYPIGFFNEVPHVVSIERGDRKPETKPMDRYFVAISTSDI